MGRSEIIILSNKEAALQLIIQLFLTAALLGCSYKGFHREHNFKVLHIFGIGWIREKTTTNDVRAFAIGSLDAGHYVLTMNTNAPTSLKRKETVETNKP